MKYFAVGVRQKQCNVELDLFKLFITCPVTNMEKSNCKEQSQEHSLQIYFILSPDIQELF